MTTTQTTVEVSIDFVDGEMSDRRYGKIHRTGCRDLVDPSPLGPVHDFQSLAAAHEARTYWDLTPAEIAESCAPCVPAHVRKPRLPHHTNDLGDWCPYSGDQADTDGGCPQGCAAARPHQEDQ